MTAVVQESSTICDDEVAGNSLSDELRRVCELKELFSQRQDAQTTNNAIDALLPILQDSTASRVLLRTALTALITILSNVQAKSLPSDSVATFYKLMIPSPNIHITQDEHLLSRLRVVDLTIAKSGQKPEKHILEAVVSRLAGACFFGPRIEATRNPARVNAAPSARTQVTNPSSYQSMGNFSFDSRSTTPQRSAARKASVSSLSSRRSSRSLAASDSEASDFGRSRRKSEDAAAIRLEGLKVLSALAKIDTRALHPYWTSFFGPSATPSLMSLAQQDLSMAVRLQAVHTTRALLVNSKGYLGLARESKQKLAFTPLSQTLADIANDLNSQILDLLRTCFFLKAQDLLRASLQLACAVIASSPYGRLATPHLDCLISTVLEPIPHVEEPASIEALAEMLVAVNNVQKASLVLSDSTDILLKKTVGELLRRISRECDQNDAPQQASLWRLLAALLTFAQHGFEIEKSARSAILEHVENTFLGNPARIQSQQIECLVALLTPSIKLPQSILQYLLSAMPNITALNVNASVVALLVSVPEFLQDHVEDMISLLSSLADSNNKDARISAIKSTGILLQSLPIDKMAHPGMRCFDILLSNAVSGTSSVVRAEAYWNLANALEAVPSEILDTGRLCDLLATTTRQILAEGASRDAEMIRTSAIRITGNLLCTIESIDAVILESAKRALATVLITGSPKTQWNAAAAMKKLIIAKKSDAHIVNALLTCQRDSKNIKVQNSIVNALEALPDDELERGRRFMAQSTNVEHPSNRCE